MAHDDLIAELAEKLGVAASYQDQNDRRCDIALATRRALVEALGYPAANGGGGARLDRARRIRSAPARCRSGS